MNKAATISLPNSGVSLINFRRIAILASRENMRQPPHPAHNLSGCKVKPGDTPTPLHPRNT
ncbi:hypothetical protein U9M48_032376 [Paspalum notatum var. saurae]|uniref:Uncharacterized protein n=1 Tax=Paspalum notatum var. saurae TaxID=547442 RepID=A0AAQ3U5F1_PASNO